MPLPAFGPSQPLSLGVELELQLVNTVDFDLTSDANDLLGQPRDAPANGVRQDAQCAVPGAPGCAGAAGWLPPVELICRMIR